MLSYTFGTNGIKPKHQYEINYFDDKQIKKDIQQAKEVADVIFVSAHWEMKDLINLINTT